MWIYTLTSVDLHTRQCTAIVGNLMPSFSLHGFNYTVGVNLPTVILCYRSVLYLKKTRGSDIDRIGLSQPNVSSNCVQLVQPFFCIISFVIHRITQNFLDQLKMQFKVSIEGSRIVMIPDEVDEIWRRTKLDGTLVMDTISSAFRRWPQFGNGYILKLTAF